MQHLLRAASHLPSGRATFKPGIITPFRHNLCVRPRCSSQLHCTGGNLCEGFPQRSNRTARPASAAYRLMATAGTSQHTHTNRLAQEESPYLLQLFCTRRSSLLTNTCRWTGTPGRLRHLKKPKRKINPSFSQLDIQHVIGTLCLHNVPPNSCSHKVT